MERSNFDRLLERYLSGQVSEAERLKIEAWLDSRKTKDERASVWSADEEERLFARITDSLNNTQDTGKTSPDFKHRRRFTIHFSFKIAASVALLIGCSAILYYAFRSHASVEQMIVSTTRPRKVILSDGSIVWLQPKSNLLYFGNRNGERRAELQGEGLFEVAKDAAHPFVIRCTAMTVKVVGTSFYLKTNERGIELDVLTGKVNVSNDFDKHGVMVLPNEKVRIDNKDFLPSKAELKAEEAQMIIAPTDYFMRFRNTALSEVMEKIERKFDVHLTIGNPEIFKCRITADFTDHSLDATMQMLSDVLDIKYKINGKNIFVDGRGCN